MVIKQSLSDLIGRSVSPPGAVKCHGFCSWRECNAHISPSVYHFLCGMKTSNIVVSSNEVAKVEIKQFLDKVYCR